METEKTFIIGDIHGCLGMLEELFSKIPWRPGRDALVFVGDYIDRGRDSRGVVDYIMNLAEKNSGVICLMGNHEAMLLDYLSGKNRNLYLANQGLTTLRQYLTDGPIGGDALIPPDHMAFYRGLRPFLELDGYYVVHAGFRPGIDIMDQKGEDLIWIREPFISSGYDFGKKVIFGHTVFPEPLIMDNKIGLDTGAVYGNCLTCIELPGEYFYSVEA